MYHLVFFFIHCSLLLSSFLSLFFNPHMQSSTIGSINIHGGRDKHKRALVSEIVSQNKIDVLFLQETHSDQADEVDWGLWWEGPHVLSHGTSVSAGVAILCRATANAVMLSVSEVVKGRLLIVRAEMNGSVLCIVNIYAPNQGSDRVGLFTKIQSELRNYSQDHIILGGDFNCTADFTQDRTNEEPHPQSSQCLKQTITDLDLFDTWRLKHPHTRQYTWIRIRNKQGQCSQTR